MDGDRMTLADIQAFPEILQLNMTGLDISAYKNIVKWGTDMMQNKHVRDSNQVVIKTITKRKIKPYFQVVEPKL